MPARSSARRNSRSSPASHSPASLASSPRGPKRSRYLPMLCAPPIGTIATPSASRSRPRRFASVWSATWSLVPSTSTAARLASVIERAPGAGGGVRAVRLDVLHVAGLPLDALEPRAQVRVRLHVDPGLVGQVAVAVDRDVGDRVPAADEEVARREVVVKEAQHLERA